MDIGEINLHPGDTVAPIELALKVGAYSWKVPQFNDLLSAALDLMVSNEAPKKAKQQTPQDQIKKYGNLPLPLVAQDFVIRKLVLSLR
ncbi:MAG: hypothetical protein ABFS56_01095 [Pseudomonadota bacterium]